jgi:flagellar biosynthesis protein
MAKDSKTNFASAIKLDPEASPKVVAQGHGALARGIEATARLNNVPVLQDFALSEELAAIPLGNEIPEELIFSIATVFDYLLSMDDDPSASID